MSSVFRLLRSRLAGASFLAVAIAAAATLTPRPGAAQSADAPRVADLGTCRLASGATIPDCRVAYRAFGRLSAARDNVILVPTFFAGRSEDHRFMLGTYVDTTRYHVVIVDALADGHSSSPSNSAAGDAAFVALTIGDMVDVQHRLLTEQLGIRRVRAVIGISMGGFQAFEWAVRHPDFMDAVVPVVGTPRRTTYDGLVYATMRRAVEDAREPGAATDSAWTQASRVENLFMRTRRFVNDSGPARLSQDVASYADGYRASWSTADYAAQVRALESHDIAARFGGDMQRAARAVKARMLVVWSPDDGMVSPEPAAAFAKLAGAEALEVPSACGHSVFWCEAEELGRQVRAFIDREAAVAAPAVEARRR